MSRVAGHGAAPADLLPAALASTLTRREREVVQLAAQGLTAREVGSLLFIGERTVESHLAHAYAKLGIHSKLDLVRLMGAHAERTGEFRTGTDAVSAATA